MQRFKILAGVVPAIALAACLDSAPASIIAAPQEPKFYPSRGAAIAMETCAFCHGGDLKGGTYESVSCPSLTELREYSAEEFDALFLTGVTRDGRSTDGFMLPVGLDLTADERRAVLDYLRTYFGT